MLWFSVAIFSILIAILGLGSIALVQFCWDTVIKIYSSTKSKYILATLKLISGVIAVWARSASELDRQSANAATTSGLIGLCVWELVGIMGDSKTDSTRRRDEGALQVVKEESLLRIRLLAALTGLVHHKKQRIWQELERRPVVSKQFDRVGSMKAGLSTNIQMNTLLQQMASFLKDQLPQVDESTHQNFRIGLYIENEGLMTPIVSWDMAKKREMFFTSYQKHPKHFRIDCLESPSCVVQCYRNKEVLIVSDCEKELPNFLNENQKNYLKSLVAYPIVDYRRPSAPITAVLVIDTDCSGFFRNEDRSNLVSCLDHFAARLDLEDSIDRLLQPVPKPEPESIDVESEKKSK